MGTEVAAPVSPVFFFVLFGFLEGLGGGIRAAGISRTALLLYYLLSLEHNAKFFPKLHTLLLCLTANDRKGYLAAS